MKTFRPARSEDCPKCGADKGKRAPKGFGTPPPICGVCGYEFKGDQ